MSPINLCVILSRAIKLSSVVFECISGNLWRDAQALKRTAITLEGFSRAPFLFIFAQFHQKGIYSFPFKIFKETQCYYPQVPGQWFGILWAHLLQAELLLGFCSKFDTEKDSSTAFWMFVQLKDVSFLTQPLRCRSPDPHQRLSQIWIANYLINH